MDMVKHIQGYLNLFESTWKFPDFLTDLVVLEATQSGRSFHLDSKSKVQKIFFIFLTILEFLLFQLNCTVFLSTISIEEITAEAYSEHSNI